MAWIRQLPSGLWAATIYTYPGDPSSRLTKTDELKGVVVNWASEEERKVRRGEFIHPSKGEITVRDFWEEAKDARHLERASRKRNASHWRAHVLPKWGRRQLSSIMTTHITRWVVDMTNRGVGATTIEGSLGVLRLILDEAAKSGLIAHNPARGIKAPRRSAHLDRVLTSAEDLLLFENLDRVFGRRPDARLFCEVLAGCGLRWAEAAAIDRLHVDMRRHLISIGPVVETNGIIRPYPKSPAGVRQVPVDDDLWPRLRDHVLTVAPGSCLDTPPKGLLFTSMEGGVMRYSRWHHLVWQRGLVEVVERGPRRTVVRTRKILDDPQPTPHDLRHGYGTRLANNGVPVHEIMKLMGHENLSSAQRYIHAGDERFDRAREAIGRARAARS